MVMSIMMDNGDIVKTLYVRMQEQMKQHGQEVTPPTGAIKAT